MITALSLPNRSRKKTTTSIAMIVSTIGVGFVEPTTPLRPGTVRENAGTWRERLAPARVHSGHCHPTGASIMHSVQIGRSQRAQRTDEVRSACR